MNEEEQVDDEFDDELTLEELSHKAKTHFESREWQEAANCLNEARQRFPDEELVQEPDGSIAVRRVF